MTIRVCAGGPPEHRALEAWRIVCGGAHRFIRRQWAELVALQHKACFICTERMDFSNEKRGKNPRAWTYEHVFPRGVGGQDASNVLLAHRVCNEDKAQRWPYPCEVIYLFAAYAPPYDAPAMRLAKVLHTVARNQRRRHAIDEATR